MEVNLSQKIHYDNKKYFSSPATVIWFCWKSRVKLNLMFFDGMMSNVACPWNPTFIYVRKVVILQCLFKGNFTKDIKIKGKCLSILSSNWKGNGIEFDGKYSFIHNLWAIFFGGEKFFFRMSAKLKNFSYSLLIFIPPHIYSSIYLHFIVRFLFCICNHGNLNENFGEVIREN